MKKFMILGASLFLFACGAQAQENGKIELVINEKGAIFNQEPPEVNIKSAAIIIHWSSPYTYVCHYQEKDQKGQLKILTRSYSTIEELYKKEF